MNECPVFTPTMEEFADFSTYVKSIEPFCKCGLAKVIPPKEWLEWTNDVDYDNLDIVIPSPIRQHVIGNKGVYQLLLVESNPVTVQQFKDIAEKEKPSKSKYNQDDAERIFWKNVRFNPPMYGADMNGTLFPKTVESWNPQRLGTMLDVVGASLPGVTQPFLYFGMFKAMFAWHVEDMNLFSINYLHFGEPKRWYAVPPEHGKKMERLLQGYFPDQLKQCGEFIRHKTSMVSPTIIMQNQIPVTHAVQEKGQFMITFPYAYHAGFNCGFNCAESVNFAIESWVDWGRKAKSCQCESDTVRIDVDILLDRFELYKQGLIELDPLIEYDAPPIKGEEPMKGGRKMMAGKRHKELPNEFEKDDTDIVGDGNSTDSNEDILRGTDIENPFEDDEESDLDKDDEEFKDTRTRNSNKKRNRQKLNRRRNEEETQTLELYYEQHDGVIDKELRAKIATELNWTPQGVYNWFRRKKTKANSEQPKKVSKQEDSPKVVHKAKNSSAHTSNVAEKSKKTQKIELLPPADFAPTERESNARTSLKIKIPRLVYEQQMKVMPPPLTMEPQNFYQPHFNHFPSYDTSFHHTPFMPTRVQVTPRMFPIPPTTSENFFPLSQNFYQPFQFPQRHL